LLAWTRNIPEGEALVVCVKGPGEKRKKMEHERLSQRKKYHFIGHRRPPTFKRLCIPPRGKKRKVGQGGAPDKEYGKEKKKTAEGGPEQKRKEDKKGEGKREEEKREKGEGEGGGEKVRDRNDAPTRF